MWLWLENDASLHLTKTLEDNLDQFHPLVRPHLNPLHFTYQPHSELWSWSTLSTFSCFFLHFHQFSSGWPCWLKSWPWLSACFLGGCGPRWLGPLCHGEGRGFLGTLANLGSRWHGQPPAGWAAPCLWFSGARVFWLWGLSWGPSFFFWGANSSYRYVALGLEYFGEL